MYRGTKMADELIFERKLSYNAGAFKVTIPIEIVKAMDLQKGDIIGIVYKNGSFICKKMKE